MHYIAMKTKNENRLEWCGIQRNFVEENVDCLFNGEK